MCYLVAIKGVIGSVNFLCSPFTEKGDIFSKLLFILTSDKISTSQICDSEYQNIKVVYEVNKKMQISAFLWKFSIRWLFYMHLWFTVIKRFFTLFESLKASKILLFLLDTRDFNVSYFIKLRNIEKRSEILYPFPEKFNRAY